MRNLSWASAVTAALLAVLPDLAGPAKASEPVQLTDNLLDKVTAGLSATGTGSGAAQGMVSSSEASVTTAVGASGDTATAVGLVTASASSKNPAGATASSILSLIVVVP
jgi:hypothetical protein